MRLNNALKTVVFLVWTIPFLLLVYFGYLYFIDSRKEFVIDYDFCKASTRRITGLTPYGRVKPIDKQKCIQRMIIDPVYFDVNIPRRYKRAEVYIDYSSDVDFRLGVKKNFQKWEWNFSEPIITSFGNYNRALFVFALDEIDFNKKLGFMISAPSLQDDERFIDFYNLKVIFK